MTTLDLNAPASGENEEPELTLDQQIEQVEEAADAIADALNSGDVERADNIMRQLETWRANLSSTLETARSQPNPALTEVTEELRQLREELNALRNPTPPNPSVSQTPSELLPPTPSPTPILTPPSGASLTGVPESAELEEPAPPPLPESPRLKRRGM